MSRFSLLIALILSLSALFFYTSAQADTTTTVVERHVVITPAPKSTKCTTVNGHWDGDVWLDAQTVCTYSDRAEGAAWVQDYWACTAATADGSCTSWQYRPGHWVQTMP
jgi:hypothetical protein